MKKIITTLMLCCILISAFSLNVFAQDDDYGVMPCYDNVSRTSLSIIFDGTTGTAKGTATKVTGVDSLEGTIDVYQKVNGQWEYVCSGSNSTTGRSLVVTAVFTAVANAEYKAVFTIIAYGETTETIVTETTKTND